MKSKTVIAFAVASAFAWPLASSAHDSARARVPLSVNETGDAQMDMRNDRFPHRDYMESGSWEVQTPLSVNETAPASEWTGIANDRIATSGPIERNSRAPSNRTAMTAPSDNEASPEPGATTDELSAAGQSGEELSAAEQSSEDLALADQGIYGENYLVAVPSQTEYIVTESQPDYYIVETVPSSSQE